MPVVWPDVDYDDAASRCVVDDPRYLCPMSRPADTRALGLAFLPIYGTDSSIVSVSPASTLGSTGFIHERMDVDHVCLLLSDYGRRALSTKSVAVDPDHNGYCQEQ